MISYAQKILQTAVTLPAGIFEWSQNCLTMSMSPLSSMSHVDFKKWLSHRIEVFRGQEPQYISYKYHQQMVGMAFVTCCLRFRDRSQIFPPVLVILVSEISTFFLSCMLHVNVSPHFFVIPLWGTLTFQLCRMLILRNGNVSMLKSRVNIPSSPFNIY